jgi:flagellar biosynthetic protein FliP
MPRALVISLLILLSLATFARGQTVAAAAGEIPALAPAVPFGPPSPAQAQGAAREQQLRTMMGDLGLPVQSLAGAAGGAGRGADAGAVALPDITQTIPTTAEPKKLSSSLQILLLLSVLTLAPSILLMTTCFTRIVIVMSLLRQALGAAQLPPNQILIGLSLFMTFLVMGPTWSRVNAEAIVPYTSADPNVQITQGEAFARSVKILREFMIKQIEGAHNEDDVYLFHGYAHPGAGAPQTWAEVDTTSLVPAFILSELKVAFLMGFRIYLPFLIIDMVISSVLISIGMQLLPPVMVSLPFKLLLFVLVDGWHLVCATLLASFG